jgi:hypothetical protein
MVPFPALAAWTAAAEAVLKVPGPVDGTGMVRAVAVAAADAADSDSDSNGGAEGEVDAEGDAEAGAGDVDTNGVATACFATSAPSSCPMASAAAQITAARRAGAASTRRAVLRFRRQRPAARLRLMRFPRR